MPPAAPRRTAAHGRPPPTATGPRDSGAPRRSPALPPRPGNA
ncbi:hypothetical protein ACFFX0_02825 [Citricoccus parietis]|uniref:Uncharacterized protein n=1 Tax=Citricoccus parietis TaxID=592307 RepID=A0ABV5FU38_9MICC